jgi:hypothetical protein
VTEHCCPDHDPLRVAGFVACSTCGRRSWPVDACWTDERVLATFESGCGHVRAQTWLIDPAAHQPDRRWCGELTATTGEPCRRRAGPDGGPCSAHARREADR